MQLLCVSSEYSRCSLLCKRILSLAIQDSDYLDHSATAPSSHMGIFRASEFTPGELVQYEMIKYILSSLSLSLSLSRY